MRIDDENKVVVPEFVADYIEKHYDAALPTSWDKADLIRDWDNYISVSDRKDVAKWIKDPDNFLVFVIAIATNNYSVQPKKYYWRKKKEYITILDTRIHLGAGADCKGALSKDISQRFTEAEARDLLKDDFDKFEKVECE